MSDWITTLKPQGSALRAVSSPETVAEAVSVLGEDVTQWGVELASRISAELASRARSDPSLRLTQVEHRACEASLLVVLSSLAPGEHALLKAPVEAVEQVRLAVRQGTPIENVLRVVWMCHTANHDALLSVIGQVVPPEHVVAEVRAMSRQLLAFVDLLVHELSECYEAERAVWQDRLTVSRRQIIEEIVATGRAPEEAEEILGIRLGRHHLAGIVWSQESAGRDDGHVSVAAFAERVAEETGASAAVVLAQSDGTVVVLWSYPDARRADLSRDVQAVERPAALSLAVGAVAAGVRGFRASVLGARRMLEFGRRQGRAGSWAYDHDGLFALLATDSEAAGLFVRQVLHGLTDRDARSAAIRDTLRAYLEHGRSRQAAAHELSVAANTVAYRVEQAARSLGRPVTERATDTVVALLLARECPWLLSEDLL